MSGVLTKDDNGYPVSGGVSSSDPNVVLDSQIDDITGRLLVDPGGTFSTVASGSGVPGTTPTYLGSIYVDTSVAKVYISTGTSSSADWTLMN